MLNVEYAIDNEFQECSPISFNIHVAFSPMLDGDVDECMVSKINIFNNGIQKRTRGYQLVSPIKY
jgi:hypothetical protein